MVMFINLVFRQSHFVCIGTLSILIERQIYLLPFSGRDSYIIMRCRSSHQRCSLRKGVLRNFPKFTGKYLCQSLFLLKLQTSACNFIKKETMTQMFFCKFCEISKKTFLQHVSGRLLLEIFYSRFKFKCSFLFRSFQHGRSSSFDKRQHYHELLV